MVGWTLLAPVLLWAAPQVVVEGPGRRVAGDGWRAVLTAEQLDLQLDLALPGGQWLPVLADRRSVGFGWMVGGAEVDLAGRRATFAEARRAEGLALVWQAPLPGERRRYEWQVLAVAEGLLMRTRLVGEGPVSGAVWSPPRLRLPADQLDGYRFWDAAGKLVEGRLGTLNVQPSYAGVTTWGQGGPQTPALSPQHGALIATTPAGLGLGVVQLGPVQRDATHAFLQLHTPTHLYFYGGLQPLPANGEAGWCWLTAFPADAAAAAAKVRQLRELAPRLLAATPFPSPPAPTWGRPLPAFPAELRRARPVSDPLQAVVYTMGETTRTPAALDLARQVGSDLIVRGWFKWRQAPPVAQLADLPRTAHGFGTLFGGGITCSALYDDENGLTREQLLEMATRGPDGQLVDAWDQPGCRHGSLSSPAYLDYLFRWCREQIDAGADYLFMDEPNAAHGALEGFDDPAIADFRRWLLSDSSTTRGWAATDPRWQSEYGIALGDRRICPDGGVGSLDYRAFLAAAGATQQPHGPLNKLTGLWHQFRIWRDDRAWHSLTDRIRAYAAAQGRTVWLSGNGLIRYVDLQVLGVWGHWRPSAGRVDLRENQLPAWRGMVINGQRLADRPVPTVIFHDWGFGDTPFPWMAVSPADRELWMRTRGPEIYAAGAYFAWPVLGPFGCDALQDGTLPAIQTLTAFYQRHRALFTAGRYLASDPLTASQPLLTLAVWQVPTGLAVHVINRDARDGVLQPRRELTVSLPLTTAPTAVRWVSPDWAGERPGPARVVGDRLEVSLAALDASAIALLDYPQPPDLRHLRDAARTTLQGRWARPERAEFTVGADGLLRQAEEFSGTFQGQLHQHLRNPPTLLVNARTPGVLRLKVTAVATAGARLEFRLDGVPQATVELPDLDGLNDSGAPEYDRVVEFRFPAGRHRLGLDNLGGDWASLAWIELQGEFLDP
ncbi:MAG: hypothetical protein IT204_22305 [Fimbriimonadaceae bacterium]|nr:hypothetical protein [Fimbriimonadaceae bacterium]